tara:strand:- start:176 stop:364 length:189 start_codon:yes stop_codon:yes gene_type:complete
MANENNASGDHRNDSVVLDQMLEQILERSERVTAGQALQTRNTFNVFLTPDRDERGGWPMFG